MLGGGAQPGREELAWPSTFGNPTGWLSLNTLENVPSRHLLFSTASKCLCVRPLPASCCSLQLLGKTQRDPVFRGHGKERRYFSAQEAALLLKGWIYSHGGVQRPSRSQFPAAGVSAAVQVPSVCGGAGSLQPAPYQGGASSRAGLSVSTGIDRIDFCGLRAAGQISSLVGLLTL